MVSWCVGFQESGPLTKPESSMIDIHAPMAIIEGRASCHILSNDDSRMHCFQTMVKEERVKVTEWWERKQSDLQAKVVVGVQRSPNTSAAERSSSSEPTTECLFRQHSFSLTANAAILVFGLFWFHHSHPNLSLTSCPCHQYCRQK